MEGVDALGLGSQAGKTLAAILFISSGTNAMDVFSATNSSPWTAYKFANDERAVEALHYYVRHAIAITVLMNGGGAIIAGSPWPIVGAAASSAYMYWLYVDAVKRGESEQTEGWAQNG